MLGMNALSDRTTAPAQETRRGRKLELVVHDTGSPVTAKAIAAACALAGGLDARITLLSIRVIPWPAPLARSTAFQEHVAARLHTYAAAAKVPLRGRIVYARDERAAWRSLRRDAIVLIATRKHWWRTREEKLAGRLTSRGFRVLLVEVR